MRVDSSVEAHRNTTLALTSCSFIVSTSMTLAPLTLFVFGSYSNSRATLFGRKLSLPVARAAGSVALRLLK
jgi:hypothetical protein